MVNSNVTRREMLKKVQEADFFALDLQLYLNTHPNCSKALKLYTDAARKAAMLRKEYEESFGPLTATQTPNVLPWQWAKNPWTWENERS